MRQQQLPGSETMTIGMLILGRRRPGFDPEWAAQVVSALERQGLPEPFVPWRPAVPITDEGSLLQALAACRVAGALSLLVLQPTMSDGNLAVVLAQQWPGPLVLWATPERPVGDKVSSCSLVGTHLFASTLRQLGRPFELVYGLPGEAQTVAELASALRLVTAVEGIAQSTVGLIGYHAPGFTNLSADAGAFLRQTGARLRHLGLHELQDAMAAVPAAEAVADAAALRDSGLPCGEVTPDELVVASRYYLALRTLQQTERLAALALRCWPELPNVIGQWPYLALARLASEGHSIACEGDADGALCCLIASRLGLGQTHLSDWLAHDRETISLWHGGCAPFGLCEPIGSSHGPRVSRHFNNRKAAVVDADLLADMPVTLFRLWRCDHAYRLAAFEGTTLVPRRPLQGTNGLAAICHADVRDLFDALCHEGMPHHLAMVRGHHARILRRWARLAGVQVVSGH
jgi:L-fucose isomerase-like protein